MLTSVRVLITADCVGGIWRYAIDIGREMADRGAEVIVACLGPRPSPAQRTEAAAAGVEAVWLPAEMDWMARGPEALVAGGRLLGALIRERSPTVVHLNNPALRRYVDCPRPCVVAVHSCVATWWAAVKGTPLPDEWLWNAEATRAGLSGAGCVLSPTHAFASMLRAAYGPLPNLRVVGNGTHPTRPERKEEHVLAVGRWWDEAKDARTLDAAAAQAHYPVHAAGPLDGPNGTSAALFSAQWLGEMSHEAVLARTARTRVFVSPARYEPFGLAVLEAAAAGVALVLADIPSFRELWDGAAMFFAAGNATALAELIDRVCDDESLRAALAVAARERAADYTIERQVNSLLAAYAQAGAVHQRVA